MNTPDGVLNFNWCGEATIKEAVKRSWTRKLWKLDKRCPDFDQESAEIDLCKLMCRMVLFASWSFSIPVTTWSVFSDVEARYGK